MATKTKTDTTPATDKPAAPASQVACSEPATTPQSPAPVRVRITAHGVEVAGLICAAGAVLTVPADTAAALVADGLATRIY